MSEREHGESAGAIQHVATTPLNDALKGKLTGRLDIAAICARAGLPEELIELVVRTTHETRLWRTERADIAAELAGHFRDGLEAGRTPAELRTSFGDARTAARLMRRAKKRSRPLLWKAWIGAWKAVGVMLLALAAAYLVLLVRLHMDEPVLKRHIIGELNAPAKAIPERERAWPVYERAIALLDPLPQEVERDLPDDPYFGRSGWPYLAPGDPRRPAAEAYAAEQQDVLEIVRQAASMPALGLEVRADSGEEALDLGITPTWLEASFPEWKENPPVIGVLLPHLGQMRTIARLLAFDSMLARERGEIARWLRNIRALAGLAEHVRQSPFMISDLVSMAILVVACDETARMLESSAGMLSDAEWAEVAHMLGSHPRDGEGMVRFHSERAFFEDTLQRIYSDDGKGGGHVTATGMRFLGPLGAGTPEGSRLARALAPVVAVVRADRHATMREYERVVGNTIARASESPWLWTEAPDTEFKRVSENPWWKARFAPIPIVVSEFVHGIVTGHQVQLIRDALLAAIALELHKRREGEYPASLAELSPTLLPRTPLDMFDGRPVRYKVVDGVPVIYSIGADREDDGGVRPAPRHEWDARAWRSETEVAEMLADPERRARIDADWVLYPPRPLWEPPQESQGG